MKRTLASLMLCSIILLHNSLYPIELDSNYPVIVEKLLFYKNDRFKVFYGGPVERFGGGVRWIMPISFEDDLYQTRAVYEVSFINCLPTTAKDAEILFVDVSDINIKFKNLLSKDYQNFSSLLSGKYSSKKYIVVRAADISNVFYPDIYISTLPNKFEENDKKSIVNFLHSHLEAKDHIREHYVGCTREEIEFENEKEVSYKPIVVKINFNGRIESFNLVKKKLKNDEWKIYYIISKEHSGRSGSVGRLRLADIPLVRIDSGCVSGQIYDDATCDCLDQLHEGLYQISQETAENSILIHIPAQDGRGYGTSPKAETEIYKQGGRGRVHKTEALDTVSGAKLLYASGIYDIRTYDGAARILKNMGFNKICLLTDNSVKVRALERYGIEVIRRKTKTQKETCIKHIESKKNSSFYYKD